MKNERGRRLSRHHDQFCGPFFLEEEEALSH